MDELRRVAAIVVEDPPIARTPLAELERRASRRVGRRRLSIAIVAIVVLMIGVGALARVGTSDTDLETQSTEAVAAHQHGDLVIFMRADATAPQVDAVRQQLLADPTITGVLYATQADSMDDFRCLFADQKEIVENVTADILPSSFRIDIADGTSGAGAVKDRLEDQPGVLSILSPTEMATGTAPTTPGMELSDEPSPLFTSDCPLIGTVLK